MSHGSVRNPSSQFHAILQGLLLRKPTVRPWDSKIQILSSSDIQTFAPARNDVLITFKQTNQSHRGEYCFDLIDRNRQAMGSNGTCLNGSTPTSFSDNPYDTSESLNTLTSSQDDPDVKWTEAYNLARKILAMDESGEDMDNDTRIQRLNDLFLSWEAVYGKVKEDISSNRGRSHT